MFKSTYLHKPRCYSFARFFRTFLSFFLVSFYITISCAVVVVIAAFTESIWVNTIFLERRIVTFHLHQLLPVKTLSTYSFYQPIREYSMSVLTSSGDVNIFHIIDVYCGTVILLWTFPGTVYWSSSLFFNSF